ncbi:iron donor protein CyaY [Pseudomonas neustonica]|uniref:iron donor protein CyaY n=1 Tax=Pseudomonas neustonica TaxID=2487346 RepID=UPI003CADDDA0
MQDVSEAEFHQQVDHVQDLIEHAVDACDLDLEMEHMEGSLVLVLADGTRLVVGRQPASRELWLATPNTTLHFGYHGEQGWQHDSGEGSLSEVLSQVLEELTGDEVELELDEVAE